MAEPVLITIQTNFTPPLTLNPLSKSDVKGGKNFLTTILQPSIDANLPILGNVHYAPAGEPSGYGVIILVAIGALAAYGLYKIIK